MTAKKTPAKKTKAPAKKAVEPKVETPAPSECPHGERTIVRGGDTPDVEVCAACGAVVI